jgi:PP-loop superfamily ATP-utilizing enzyme
MFVRRLEERVADQVAGRRVVLAYSGGLASTVVAAVARKRCDLECVVAGAVDSDDVRAANEAKRYLDYRITTAVIDAAETKRILRRAKEALPRLSLRAILPLLPVFAVATRSEGDVCLTGLGLPRSDPPVLDALRRLHIRSPIADAFAGTRGSRDLVRAAATSLGLPVRWARVRHRGPLAGAGIAAFVESVDVEEALKGSSPGS